MNSLRHLTLFLNNMKLNSIRIINPFLMKTKNQPQFLRWLIFAMIPILILVSCREEEEFAITNDLRVLFVSVNGDRSESGITGVPVNSSVQLVFSHGLNKTEFEKALTISPDLDFALEYDETGSFVTITPDVRLDYDIPYTISLPIGTYGSKGESSKEDFNYQLNTGEFVPPTISLSADKLSFFEGETVTVTTSLSEVVFVDVKFDLEFTGSAQSGGADYTSSASSIIIPAGQTEATFTLTSNEGDAVEGTEDIIISLGNVLNGTYKPIDPFTIALADRAPSIELKGVMYLKTSANGNGVRAVHLNVLKDIADLSTYGVEVNSNGSTATIDPANLDYYFPAIAVSAGDQILLVRDADAANAAAYFDGCFSQFDRVFETSRMTQNGNDAILLYSDGVSIDTFGEFGVNGTGKDWEYTGSWGYKLGAKWIYGTVDCAKNVDTGTTQNSACVYPMCSKGLEFLGIMSLQPTAGRIRAFHLRALKDISDLSAYGVGIASNGQATSDGVEIKFPAISVKEGESVLIIRDLDVANAANYFGNCYNGFDHIVSDGGVSSNGDDTIELFKDNKLIETYGELGVDGTGMLWDYTDSWAYKVNGTWNYAGAGCSVGAASNSSSSCPYGFCQ
ncbi:MAG: hypothetical protein ACI8YP_000371 [Algoriphagus sp.]|jgi:hypothetical protein